MLTDPMAATVAENALYDLLTAIGDEYEDVDCRAAAKAIVADHTVSLEHDGDKTRVVLTGRWEISPAAYMKPLVTAAEQG